MSLSTSAPDLDADTADRGDTLARAVPDAACALICVLAVGLVGWDAGGWWATTWGWAALGLLFVAAATLLLRPRIDLGRLDLALLATLVALTGWTALSVLWTESVQLTVLEVERTLVYLAAGLALLLVAHRRSLAAGLGALLAVDVVLCLDALATRLAPDRVTQAGSSIGFRLAGVLEYPNALGIVAALGLLLALGFAAESPSAGTRAAAGAAVVPLGLTLALANSRGALAALIVGLAVLFGLAPRRLPLVTAAAPPAALAGLVVWLASRSQPLWHWADPRAAAGDGHRVAIALGVLAGAAGLVSIRRSRATAIGLLLAAAVAVAVAPATPFQQALAYSPGTAPGTPPPGTTPGGRLFSGTTNSRTQYWRVALRDAAAHPLGGSGAGTFVREWYRQRSVKADVTDAHSLYLETLAELGAVGLALVLVLVTVPLLAGWRIRGRPYAAAACGAFAAFAAHAAVEWDWELPGVTLIGLLCGGLLVAAARPGAPAVRIRGRLRAALMVPVAALLAFAFVGLVGNRAAASALAAVTRGDWSRAASDARKASAWAPWSADALELEADAASARNDTPAARVLLRRAVAKDGSDYSLWMRLASVTSGAERQAALVRAARLDPLG